jgi:histidine triad (HIT) family protein
MPSIFTKIVRNEIPSYKVCENEEFLAFLDVFPLVKGHVLVVPKKETDYIFDMEDDSYQRMFQFAKKTARGIKKVISCKKVGIVVAGLEVPHAHIHLIPINSVQDINFEHEKLKLTEAEFAQIADEISKAI